MKRLTALLLSLLLVLPALAQSPGVGLDSLPSAGTLNGGELLFGYQAGSGGSGPTACARGWCPVSITPLQISTYITGLGRFPTISGSITTGHCVEWASATSLEDAGAACGSGGGGGLDQLTGDVTAGPGTGSQVASVVRVNGGSIPSNVPALASNSSSQIVAATSVPLFSGSFTANDCVLVSTTSPVTFADAGSACGLGVLFQTNGTPNLSQAALNLQNSNAVVVSNTSGGAVSIAETQAVNAQSGTSYTISCTSDAAKVLTFNNSSSVAVSLPQANGACGAGLAFTVENLGSGTVTITPATSTINGGSTLAIGQNRGCSVVSDGTNYQVASCNALITVGTGNVSTSGSPAGFQTSVFSSSTAITGVGPGSAGQCYMSNGSGSNPSFQTCGNTPQVQTAATGTNLTPNCTFNIVKVVANATGTFTVNAPGTCTPADGQSLILKITSPSGGTITYSWNGTYLSSATLTLPTTSNAASKEDYFAFRWDADKSGWVFLAANQGF